MSGITLNRDAVQQALYSLRPQQERTRQERGHTEQLRWRLQGALDGARAERWQSQGRANDWQLWQHHGLGGIANESNNSRSIVEEIRSRISFGVQQLLDTHPGELKPAIESHTVPIDDSYTHTLSYLWNLTNRLSWNNMLALVDNPATAYDDLGQATYWLDRAIAACDQLLWFLDRLLSGEADVIAALMADLTRPITGAQAVLGASVGPFQNGEPSLSLSTSLAGQTSATPTQGANSYMGALVWGFLASRYHLSEAVGMTTDKGILGSEAKAQAEVAGNLVEMEYRTQRNVLGLNISRDEGIAVASLDADIGASASLKDGINLGPAAKITVLRAYDNRVYGNKSLGITTGSELEVLAADGFVGVHANEIGAQVGIDLASVQGSVGLNVAGANVGLVGSIGLKAELGFEIGKKTEVKLPFVSFGFALDQAK